MEAFSQGFRSHKKDMQILNSKSNTDFFKIDKEAERFRKQYKILQNLYAKAGGSEGLIGADVSGEILGRDYVSPLAHAQVAVVKNAEQDTKNNNIATSFSRQGSTTKNRVLVEEDVEFLRPRQDRVVLSEGTHQKSEQLPGPDEWQDLNTSLSLPVSSNLRVWESGAPVCRMAGQNIEETPNDAFDMPCEYNHGLPPPWNVTLTQPANPRRIDKAGESGFLKYS